MATERAQSNKTEKKGKTQSGVAATAAEKAKAAVKNQLTQEAQTTSPSPSLDDRINRFEKLRGLANQRERLLTTLGDLAKFKYNNGDSCAFFIRDEDGKEFKTTNTNLIRLVTDHLQTTLVTRKNEIENDILRFEL